MSISAIYHKYEIMPNLQLHMLRAAAVGAYITSVWESKITVNNQSIITALLLHDMGNIIKFELEKFPAIIGNERKNLPYWQQVQKKFLTIYGTDEHAATYAIARSVGVSDSVLQLLAGTGSENFSSIVESEDYNYKIVQYADMRIAPFGVVSVNQRFDDLVKRYSGRNHILAKKEYMEKNRLYCLEVESQLQKHVSVSLANIIDAVIAPYIATLRTFSLPK